MVKKKEKKVSEEKPVVIHPIIKKRVLVEIGGDGGSLILNQKTAKMEYDIAAKEGGKAHLKKGPREPEKEYLASINTMSDGKTPAIKTHWIKAAMVRACAHVDGVTMTAAKQLFYVFGPEEDDHTRIIGKHNMHKALVNVGKFPNKGATMRYRGEFKKWKATIVLEFWEQRISLESLLNLLNIAGFACGLAEMRPEKTGMCHGVFKLLRVIGAKENNRRKKGG